MLLNDDVTLTLKTGVPLSESPLGANKTVNRLIDEDDNNETHEIRSEMDRTGDSVTRPEPQSSRNQRQQHSGDTTVSSESLKQGDSQSATQECTDPVIQTARQGDFASHSTSDNGNTASTVELSPQTVIKTYRVDSFLGSGGTSSVYKASNLLNEQAVALKISRSGRISREAELTRRFTGSSSIVHILDSGQWNEFHYLVLEFGTALDSVLKESPSGLAPDMAIRIGAEIAEALKCTHACGVLHCDVKPGNILMDTSWRAKLMDFGIAFAYGDTRNRVAGTPDYMSPEQAKGESLDPRTDIFSLGATLYALLTGSPPYAGTSKADVLENIRANNRPPLLKREHIPNAFIEIVERAMAYNPAQRYQAAGDMAMELRSLLNPITTAGLMGAPSGNRSAPKTSLVRRKSASLLHTLLRPFQHSRSNHKAFISYRRSGGAETARLIRCELLLKYGIRAFLDVEDLGSYYFDERLLRIIERTPNLIVILTPDCLMRRSEGDWFLREIAHAVQHGRNIVGIVKDGFAFPEEGQATVDLSGYGKYASVEYSHTHMKSLIDQVMARLMV